MLLYIVYRIRLVSVYTYSGRVVWVVWVPSMVWDVLVLWVVWVGCIQWVIRVVRVVNPITMYDNMRLLIVKIS